MPATRVDPTSQRREIRGLSLNYWEWPSDSLPAPVDLLFIHATGFHARVWDPVIRRLPTSWRCLALDMRGHGLSDEAADGYDWEKLVADTAAAAEALDLKSALGVGHSMGGFVIAGAAARTQANFRFRGLVLADPTITDAQDLRRRAVRLPLGDAAATGNERVSTGAGRRRPVWDSPRAMFDSYRTRGPFDTWETEALHAYCDFALVPQRGKGMRLACPPEVEAATFAANQGSDPWPGLARLGMPAVVMRGTSDHGRRSVTSPRVAKVIPHGVDVPVPASNHFIPMERPDLVADEIGRLARSLGLPA